MGGKVLPHRVADAVDGSRLWSLLMDLARIGALKNGGVARQALTDLDTEAKNFVIAWAEARGLLTFQDEAANLFVRLEGADREAEPLLIGSHLDTQPTGGKYDGAYGVAAGLEVIEAIRHTNAIPIRSIEIVAWTNEEGSRFLPGATGSSAFAGTRSLDEMERATTVDGQTVADELARSIAGTPAPLRRMADVRPFAYLEAHIEQGPVLEASGIPVGIVEGIQGIRRLSITYRGRTAHAGTTPHDLRADALAAAARCISMTDNLRNEHDELLRLTFGRIEVEPNSPNTVPSIARLTIDLRHPSEAVLDAISKDLQALAEETRGPCSLDFVTVSAVPPVSFDERVRCSLEAAACVLGIDHRDITSGAGHDALHLARVCASGMLFIPCRDGVSHHEDEEITQADATAGARVLAFTAMQLAGTENGLKKAS